MRYKFLKVTEADIDRTVCEDWLITSRLIAEWIGGKYHGIEVEGVKWMVGDVDVPNALLLEQIYYEGEDE